jgi:uncharacterized protein
MSEVSVTGLFTYPVKSCAGIELERAAVTPRGLELDRDYMLVDDDDDFVSQRKVPELALVVPTVERSAITLQAPGMTPIAIPRSLAHDDARLVAATVHDSSVAGQIVSEELNDWFTSFLPPYKHSKRYRLLAVRADRPRHIEELYRKSRASNTLGFADGAAILLASEASLTQLNGEMEQPVPMSRFRPNIVVGGPALAPYAEDTWTELRIGALTAFVVKGCTRCVIPDIDQRTAVTGVAVRRALTTRKGYNAYNHANTGVFFAQNVNHVYEPGVTIARGDPVQVISWRAQPNVVISPARKAPARAARPARAAGG